MWTSPAGLPAASHTASDVIECFSIMCRAFAARSFVIMTLGLRVITSFALSVEVLSYLSKVRLISPSVKIPVIMPFWSVIIAHPSFFAEISWIVSWKLFSSFTTGILSPVIIKSET